jgi:hypothetical protein
MKRIDINGREYFYKKICDYTYVHPVQYKFYILKEAAKTHIIKKRKFILFGPLIDVEFNKEAVYELVFKTDRLKKFSEFPTEEIKKLEKAFIKNREIERSTHISI